MLNKVHFTVKEEVISINFGDDKSGVVTSFEEVLTFLNKEGKLALIDIIEITKTDLVRVLMKADLDTMDLDKVGEPPFQQGYLGGWLVYDGDTLGDVFMIHPAEGFETLKMAHYANYLVDLTSAVDGVLGIK